MVVLSIPVSWWHKTAACVFLGPWDGVKIECLQAHSGRSFQKNHLTFNFNVKVEHDDDEFEK